MKRSPIFKYQLGLAIIGVFTLVIVGLVLVQASATKQDTTTEKHANDIAEKLNNYVESKQAVPESLSNTGISDVPETINYKKVSASSYTFCTNYKATSSNFDSSAVALSLATGGKVDPGSSDYSSKDYLVIPSSHHKGANCQTISPYLYNSGGGSGCSLFSSSSYCAQPLQSQSSSSPSSGTAQDTERKTDINSLQSHLESYYASNGHYPTLSDLNDPAWVATNMKGLDAAALCDPTDASKSCKLVSSPSKGAYSYEVDDSNYQACTTESSCASYIVSATLSSGEQYTKYSF